MKKVLLYIRVSTTKQDIDGYSIPLQKERLIAYCKAKGWIVVGVYVDPGYSGASLERPGMDALIEAVVKKRGDAVLVYKLDRLSRSQRDVLYLLEDVFEPNGVAFVSMQESFDTSTVFGRAIIGILSVFGAMERATISERTLMGRAGRAEEGLWHGGGTEPIGYDYIDGKLVVNKEEARQIRAVYNLYASGFSVAEISRRMDGYKTKHGDWSHTSTVGNVLDNPLYAGVVRFDGVRANGKHEAIVSPEVNQRAKDRRARLRRAESSGDSVFLLTGLIRCASCGARYFPNRRPNGTVVYSCHSRAKKNKKMIKDPNCKAPHIPVADLDSMVIREILKAAEDPSVLEADAKKRAAGAGNSLADKNADEIRRLDAEIDRLMDLYQSGDLVSVGEIAERIQRAHEKRVSLSSSAERKARHFNVDGLRLLLRDFQCGYDSMDVRGLRAILFQLVDKIHVDSSGVLMMWSL